MEEFQEPKPKMITTAIHYSGLDRRFLRQCIEQSMYFSNEIIVTYYPRMWRSKAADPLYLEDFVDLAEKGVKFIELEFEYIQPHQQYLMLKARHKATELAENDYIFFLDADEIPDGPLMRTWLENNWYHNSEDVYWFTCYWYFRQPFYRALAAEACGLLAPKIVCVWDLHKELDRQQVMQAPTFNKKHWGGNPLTRIHWNGIYLMHHFSWVRDKEEMLIKAENWGHAQDRDWRPAILEEFKDDFKFTDFVHGYFYEVVPDSFRIGYIE